MKRRNFIKFGSVLVASSVYAKKENIQKITFNEQFSEALAMPPIADYNKNNN